jgi:hypothetical protein
LVLGTVLCYTCISLLLQTKDDFRFIIPYVEFVKEVKGLKPYILDTSVVIDGRIADVVEGAGAVLQAIYPIGRIDGQADAGCLKKKVIIRFHAENVREVVSAMEAAGFPVIESVETHRAALAA